MKYLIGVVGEIGAGKGTFSAIISELAGKKTLKKIRFSDVLTKTLKLWDIPLTRANLQNLAIIMDQQYGKGTLTHAAKLYINKQKADIVIIEGIRWQSDVPMIRSFPNSFIIYMTADPKIRFERLKIRNEKVGESTKTYKEFLAEEKAGTEVEIKKIGKDADFKFENNGDLGELKGKIKQFYKVLS